MTAERKIEAAEELALGAKVRGAIIWRSGSQVLGQLVTWAATFLVIRILDPQDYGLYAMTGVVLVFLNLMNGYGFASALVQSESVERERVRQVFGILILLNGGLAAAQVALAPLAAAYFRQPDLAPMLWAQALIYASTPLIAIPNALLSRDIDFRNQAKVNLLAAFLSAATALTLAWAGMGVWTLVWAPIVLLWTRAIGLTVAARSFVLPSFRFRGAGTMLRFGGALVLVQLFWFLQTQADVFIAGRLLGPHELGLYTTALFLTQILAAKFVPPLNEVAFAAYSRMQGRRGEMGTAFLKSVRLIMLAALPFYLGLAATAEPLVLTFLGPKWGAIVPLVRVLALAMPLLTLQILFSPATNALGKPGIALKTGLVGALMLPSAFFIGIRFGVIGLAYGWVAGMALLTIYTVAVSVGTIEIGWRRLAAAIGPGLCASAAMAAGVLALDSLLPQLHPAARLAILVLAGAALYAGLLFAFARGVVAEVRALLPGRKAAAQAL